MRRPAPVLPSTINVDVSPPKVESYLYGPDGEPIATKVSKPVVAFGFRPAEVTQEISQESESSSLTAEADDANIINL